MIQHIVLLKRKAGVSDDELMRAFEQAKVLNGGQQFIAGLIEAQEKSVSSLVDYQTRAAELSQIPGATAVAEVQAQVLRGVSGAYVSAARAFLK